MTNVSIAHVVGLCRDCIFSLRTGLGGGVGWYSTVVWDGGRCGRINPPVVRRSGETGWLGG